MGGGVGGVVGVATVAVAGIVVVRAAVVVVVVVVVVSAFAAVFAVAVAGSSGVGARIALAWYRVYHCPFLFLPIPFFNFVLFCFPPAFLVSLPFFPLFFFAPHRLVLSDVSAGARDETETGDLQTFGGIRVLARYVKIEGVVSAGGNLRITEVFMNM